MNNRIENIIFILALILLFCACSQIKTNNKTPSLEIEILNYLRANYKIDPDVNRLGKQFKDDKTKVDSIMFSNLKVVEYKPLNLRFINYQTIYPYIKHEDNDAYQVDLIQNISNSHYYHDRTFQLYKRGSCVIPLPDSCNFQQIPPFYQLMLTSSEINNFMAVDIPGKLFYFWDLLDVSEAEGIEQVLNTEFRFKEIEEKSLYSLFSFYDSISGYQDYKLIALPVGLYKFYSFSYEERMKEGYNSTKENAYLKEKIQELILKSFYNRDIVTLNSIIKSYIWIYANGRTLFVRQVARLGNNTMGFKYNIKEEILNF